MNNTRLETQDTTDTIPTFVELVESTDPWEVPLGVGEGGKQVVWDPRKSPHMLLTGTAGSGKSVIQRNIIFHCIQHPRHWRFVGIDVDRVDLKPYKKYAPVMMDIAVTLREGASVIRYAKSEMKERYRKMDEAGVNHFQDLPESLPALMVLVDDMYRFLGPSSAKDKESEVENELKHETSRQIGDIARLGRIVGVHLVLATQRPDPTVIYGELKENLDCRVAAGRADTIPSQLTFNNDEATRLPSIRGRGYIQNSGWGEQFQGYFSSQDWVDQRI